MEHDLVVVVSVEADHLVLRVAGQLTGDTVRAIASAADTACRERRANRDLHDAAIDLSRVGQIDADGARALDRAINRLVSHHLRVTFDSVPPALRSRLGTLAATGRP